MLVRQMNSIVKLTQGTGPRRLPFPGDPERLCGLLSGQFDRLFSSWVTRFAPLMSRQPSIGVAIVVQILQPASLKNPHRLFDDLFQPLAVRSWPEGSAVALGIGGLVRQTRATVALMGLRARVPSISPRQTFDVREICPHVEHERPAIGVSAPA